MITSHNNPKVKAVRALHQKKHRQESHLFIVEGVRHVGEAIAAGAVLESLWYAPALLTSDFAHRLIAEQSAYVATYETTPEVFESLASKENPQGILAVVRQNAYQLPEMNATTLSWGVALVAPQDPGNIGTILRTMDAVGARGLFLLDSSADVYHPTGVRASMGALFWQPIVYATFADFKAWAEAHRYTLIGTSAHNATDFQAVTSYPRPSLLVLGSEREGLSNEQAAACQLMVRLPMHGRVSSLNLAVAAGIILYDMLIKSP